MVVLVLVPALLMGGEQMVVSLVIDGSRYDEEAGMEAAWSTDDECSGDFDNMVSMGWYLVTFSIWMMMMMMMMMMTVMIVMVIVMDSGML